MLVADSGNNRVLRFAASATTGAGAIGVIGQPDLKTRTPASVVADTIHLAGPSALSTDGASLYIADRDLGRVVVIGADGKVADVLGGVGSASVLRAGAGIAARRSSTFTTRLYVSDTAADKIALVVSLSRLVAH